MNMKVLALVSGGIDSPAALYMMLTLGAAAAVVHFDNRPFTDEKMIEKSKAIVTNYRKKFGPIPLYIVPHGDAQLQFARNCDRKVHCLLCRRMMFRVAEKLAAKIGASALVTGESLGQVASQTLRNIRVESQAVSIIVLRPLIGMDKVEIEKIARRAGTYETSIAPGLCCTIVPSRPEIAAMLEKIIAEEKKVDIEALAARALADMVTA